MQGPPLQSIHQQANKQSNQAESIAAAAEGTYAENTSLWVENTNLQSKLCIYKENLNALTAQLYQLQLQTVAQAFAMNAQTMGHGGHNNVWHNKCGGQGNDRGSHATMLAQTPVMQQPTPFQQPPFPGYSPTSPSGFTLRQPPTYCHSLCPTTAISTSIPHTSFHPCINQACVMACHSCTNQQCSIQKNLNPSKTTTNAGLMVIAWGKTHTSMTCSGQTPIHVIWVTRANTCRRFTASIEGLNATA